MEYSQIVVVPNEKYLCSELMNEHFITKVNILRLPFIIDFKKIVPMKKLKV